MEGHREGPRTFTESVTTDCDLSKVGMFWSKEVTKREPFGLRGLSSQAYLRGRDLEPWCILDLRDPFPNR